MVTTKFHCVCVCVCTRIYIMQTTYNVLHGSSKSPHYKWYCKSKPHIRPTFQEFFVYHCSNEHNLKNTGMTLISSLFFFFSFTSAATTRFFEIAKKANFFLLCFVLRECISRFNLADSASATWSERKLFFLQAISFGSNTKRSCLSAQHSGIDAAGLGCLPPRKTAVMVIMRLQTESANQRVPWSFSSTAKFEGQLADSSI